MEVKRIAVLLLLFGGCAVRPVTYPYRAVTDDCMCERFRARDKSAGVEYVFTARYAVDDVINTRIAVEVWNRGRDTVDLSLAHVKVTSRNVAYRFNDRYLPVTVQAVPPGAHRTLTLVGEGPEADDDQLWFNIAGEEIVVTLKGVRLHGRELKTQVVHFIPHNPKLGT